MSLMECAISVKNCTPCWKWSSLCLMACSPVNTVKARSSPCWICWMSWCHLPLRHCRGSFKCLRSRFVWLCLKPCCLLDDLMRYKSKPRESWDRRRSLCWRGHGCVGPCLVQPASTCCKALALLGEQSPLAFWLPGIRPSAPVVRWKIGIALSGLIWPFIANSRLVCSPCSPFGIITGLLLVVSTQVFLPYNGRNLPRPLTIGWLLWVILLSLPDCSKVSHGFEPCLRKRKDKYFGSRTSRHPLVRPTPISSQRNSCPRSHARHLRTLSDRATTSCRRGTPARRRHRPKTRPRPAKTP